MEEHGLDSTSSGLQGGIKLRLSESMGSFLTRRGHISILKPALHGGS
jgi:hypothetical protein